MKKNQAISRYRTNGQFITKPLARSKASKLSIVEGMALTRKSAERITTLEARGLKGDALRSANRGTFLKKRG